MGDDDNGKKKKVELDGSRETVRFTGRTTGLTGLIPVWTLSGLNDQTEQELWPVGGRTGRRSDRPVRFGF